MTVIYEITCGKCGAPLDIASVHLNRDGDLFASVAPCESCLDERAEEAKDDGYSEGRAEGYAAGLEDEA